MGTNPASKLIHEHRKFLSEKFKSLAPKLKALMAEDVRIVTCSACGFSASCQTEDPPPIKACMCMVCGASDRYLYMPCPDCRIDQVYGGDGDIECADCGKSITVDDIIEKLSLSIDTKKERHTKIVGKNGSSRKWLFGS